MDRINTLIVKLQTRREDGQAMVEYGLILGLVSVVAVAVLTTVGTDVSAIFTQISQDLQSAL